MPRPRSSRRSKKPKPPAAPTPTAARQWRASITSCHSGSSSGDDDDFFFDSVAEPPVAPGGCDLDDGVGECPSSSEARAADASSRDIKLLMHEVNMISHN